MTDLAIIMGMATHSSIHAWKIPWTEEPWWATAHGVAKTESLTQQPLHFASLLQFIHDLLALSSPANHVIYTVFSGASSQESLRTSL